MNFWQFAPTAQTWLWIRGPKSPFPHLILTRPFLSSLLAFSVETFATLVRKLQEKIKELENVYYCGTNI